MADHMTPVVAKVLPEEKAAFAGGHHALQCHTHVHRGVQPLRDLSLRHLAHGGLRPGGRVCKRFDN